MVLVCDNALYHHKREIGSLANLSKVKTLEMMQQYGVTYIDLPLATKEREEFAKCGLDGVTNLGDAVHINLMPANKSKQQGSPFHQLETLRKSSWPSSLG